MGCIARLGCLVTLAILACVGWLTRGQWMPLLRHGGTAPVAATGTVWEPLTPAGASRAKQALDRLGQRTGPVYANLSGGDVASYVYQQLARQLPPSADSVEAAVIGDRLYIRASVRLSELGGQKTLGPLASMLGDRERMQFGGALHVLQPGLAEYQVKEIRIRDFALPAPMIPRLLRQIERGARPAGLSPDGLPLVLPKSLADVRIGDRKVTLYKRTE